MIKQNLKTTVLQLRVAPKTKHSAQKLLESKGLTLSHAVHNFLNNLSLHEDALMLAYDQPKISERTLKRWEGEVLYEVEHAKKFASTKEAIKHLKSL
jgi:antitoxin component of RelBE/YafQ-DinJ toxin-antitoxin module